ncbi:gamma carbonic anhydrase family protein [Cohnella sp. JJ-181]|uniref:gamma carbonic anhydrase family protein n=1 Tax=Cohnella rhizoplanae TaxID=2974897 RepID=UPI0022FF511D|nr:gamma carbonic anhydrase family protein [Cohnella sp. JJ-181]CAI6080969.1 Protein YrdA [Cohnella sp. JJ-181]
MLIRYGDKYPQLAEGVFVAEGAKLIGDVKIGAGGSVWFNAVIRGDMAEIRIGSRTNLQDGVVGHVNAGQPLILEDDVTVGHSAIVHGCAIGRGSLIGMGAIVLNGATIGEYAMIGAGAIVTEGKSIPPYTLSMGTPARVVRELTDQDLERMRRTADHYAAEAVKYAGGAR